MKIRRVIVPLFAASSGFVAGVYTGNALAHVATPAPGMEQFMDRAKVQELHDMQSELPLAVGALGAFGVAAIVVGLRSQLDSFERPGGGTFTPYADMDDAVQRPTTQQSTQPSSPQA